MFAQILPDHCLFISVLNQTQLDLGLARYCQKLGAVVLILPTSPYRYSNKSQKNPD